MLCVYVIDFKRTQTDFTPVKTLTAWTLLKSDPQ